MVWVLSSKICFLLEFIMYPVSWYQENPLPFDSSLQLLPTVASILFCMQYGKWSEMPHSKHSTDKGLNEE